MIFGLITIGDILLLITIYCCYEAYFKITRNKGYIYIAISCFLLLLPIITMDIITRLHRTWHWPFIELFLLLAVLIFAIKNKKGKPNQEATGNPASPGPRTFGTLLREKHTIRSWAKHMTRIAALVFAFLVLAGLWPDIIATRYSVGDWNRLSTALSDARSVRIVEFTDRVSFPREEFVFRSVQASPDDVTRLRSVFSFPFYCSGRLSE
jgi:hypothetical protein